MKKIITILLSAALCLSAAACGKKDVSEASSISEPEVISYKIAAVFKAEDTAAKQTLAGFLAAAKELNIKINMTDFYGDAQAERKALAELNSENCDGIISMPSAGEASVAELSRAAARGVPIAIVNMPLKNNDFAVLAPYTSDYDLGAAAGKEAKAYIEAELGGKADIMILEHISKNKNENIQKLNGFLDQIKDMKDAKPVRNIKSASVEEMTTQLKGYFDGAGDKAAEIIFCTDADGLLASQKAVADPAFKRKTAIFGIGLNEEIASVLKSESSAIRAIAATDYWQMGYDNANAILSAAKSGTAKAAEQKSAAPKVLKSSDDNSKRYMTKAFA
ncbi:MAG: substrate-binding domain-containing protein [Hydrogenoanaerobacterium sp.]